MQNIEVNSTISVPTAAFNQCTGVLTVNAPLLPSDVSPEEEEYVMGVGTFRYGAFTKIIIGKDVKEIPNATFYQCNKVVEVVIEEGLEILGPFAFDTCSKLKTINLPSTLTKIGAGALSGTAIESITIPEGITVLSAKTLRGCSALTTVILPTSLTKIGNYAFSGCTSLKEIVIPKNVVTIGTGIFGDCESAMSIYFMPSEPPTIAYLGDVASDIKVIYVPSGSLEKYKSVFGTYYGAIMQPYDFE